MQMECFLIPQVFLFFSIWYVYKDKLFCDVLPMDACHVPLWISWKHDRQILHDRYANTYTIKKDDKTIMLAPYNSPPKHEFHYLLLYNLLGNEVKKKKNLKGAAQSKVVGVKSKMKFPFALPILRASFIEEVDNDADSISIVEPQAKS